MQPEKSVPNSSRIPRLFARFSPRQRIIGGALLLVVCTILAFSAKPPEPENRTGSIASWLFRPIDLFADARKLHIKSDLHAIAQVPGSETVVAVGSGGLIIRSNDLGKSWEPQIVSLTSEEIRAFRKAAAPKREEQKKSKRPSSKPDQINKKNDAIFNKSKFGETTVDEKPMKEPDKKVNADAYKEAQDIQKQRPPDPQQSDLPNMAPPPPQNLRMKK